MTYEDLIEKLSLTYLRKFDTLEEHNQHILSLIREYLKGKLLTPEEINKLNPYFQKDDKRQYGDSRVWEDGCENGTQAQLDEIVKSLGG